MGGAILHLAVQYVSERPAPARAQLRRWVRGTLASLEHREPRRIAEAALTIRFVDADEGRSLNRTFRGKDYATNVLTFPYDDAPVRRGPRPVAADLVLCVPVVEAEAAQQSKTIAVHFAHLVVHGVLHACGYDHEDPREAATMEAIERDVLARFRIADPYADDART